MSITAKNNQINVSDFAAAVYQKATMIPSGKVSTYGRLASSLGLKGGARAVGQALHRNPFAPKVPCHRIIRANGQVGGFASGEKNKIKLLKAEGVEVNDGTIDLSIFGFDL